MTKSFGFLKVHANGDCLEVLVGTDNTGPCQMVKSDDTGYNLYLTLLSKSGGEAELVAYLPPASLYQVPALALKKLESNLVCGLIIQRCNGCITK
jgi:hypothetical protein